VKINKNVLSVIGNSIYLDSDFSSRAVINFCYTLCAVFHDVNILDALTVDMKSQMFTFYGRRLPLYNEFGFNILNGRKYKQ